MLKRSFVKLILSAALIGGFSLSVMAADTRASLAGAKVVKADEAKKLADAGAAVIDTRVATENAEKTIKGSKNVVYKEKSVKAVDFDASADQFDLTKLPSDKAAPIVFFCNGPECWKSYKGSTAALKAGYSKVFWFRGGMPEWVAAGLPTQ